MKIFKGGFIFALAMLFASPVMAQAVHHGVCGTYHAQATMDGNQRSQLTLIFKDNSDAPGTCPDRLHNAPYGGIEIISIYGTSQTAMGTKPSGLPKWCFESVSGFINTEVWFGQLQPVGGNIMFEAVMYLTPEPGLLNQSYCAARPTHSGAFVFPIGIEGVPIITVNDNSLFTLHETRGPSFVGTMHYWDRVQ